MDIATGYAALSSAFEIAKGLKNIDDRVKLNAAVIELQEKILSAQQASTESKSKLAEMERRLGELEEWESTAKRYALKDFGCQTFAYQSKAESLNGGPSHLACPNCFQMKRLSVLQYHDTYYGRKQFWCLACSSKIDLGCIQPERTGYTVDSDFDPFRY